jgi:hypothetical protein
MLRPVLRFLRKLHNTPCANGKWEKSEQDTTELVKFNLAP